MRWQKAPEIQREVERLIERGFSWIEAGRVKEFRSYGSKSRAVARVWGLPKIWQLALGIKSHYCVELVSERFDRQSRGDRRRVLIHELMHIPKNFSGSLLPHKSRGRAINREEVEKMVKKINAINSR